MSDTGHERTALIIGASRGLGLGLVERHLERGWRVIATARGPAPRLEAAGRDAKLSIEPFELTDPASLDKLVERLAGTPLDLLLVNAGIMDSTGGGAISGLAPSGFDEVMRTNALFPILLVERLRHQMRDGGVVAVMSSSLGSVANNSEGNFDAYRASKAALNTLLLCVAARAKQDGLTYIAVDPGWVRTDMGGDGAPLDIATSTSGVADMLERRRGRGGASFVDYRNAEVAW